MTSKVILKIVDRRCEKNDDKSEIRTRAPFETGKLTLLTRRYW